MRKKLTAMFFWFLTVFTAIGHLGQPEEVKPDDAYFTQFHPWKAPAPARHFLRANDRLAICGDSITEQKMYSRIIETYLTVCVPEMKVTVRQFGWSGERAPEFLARMTNDCLRFKPTIETTCYGMNDHGYQPYNDRIGDEYRKSSTAIVESFKAHGVRVIDGSPGCVGKVPGWSTFKNATVDDLNLNLCQLRNIDIEIARKEKTGFADVFWPMLVATHETQLQYGTNFALSGRDGVHPNWAGHLVMAYAFLHSFGLDGDVGTFTVDMTSNKARASAGHELLGFKNGELRIRSHRYPFCIGEGDAAKDDNIRAGTMLTPFNQELNRLMLVVTRPKAKSYLVTWGAESKSFSSEQLIKGINLPQEFGNNPFSEAFKKVDDAVAAKQAFETREIKKTFRSAEARTDMERTVKEAEKQREPLVAAAQMAFIPVIHTIKIVPE